MKACICGINKLVLSARQLAACSGASGDPPLAGVPSPRSVVSYSYMCVGRAPQRRAVAISARWNRSSARFAAPHASLACASRRAPTETRALLAQSNVFQPILSLPARLHYHRVPPYPSHFVPFVWVHEINREGGTLTSVLLSQCLCRCVCECVCRQLAYFAS